jgi:hypothetical protein
MSCADLMPERVIHVISLACTVFLSHSFEDRSLVGPLENSLKGVGIDPYIAEEHPKAQSMRAFVPSHGITV